MHHDARSARTTNHKQYGIDACYGGKNTTFTDDSCSEYQRSKRALFDTASEASFVSENVE
jgi:hypothetical protein